ncbi:MAG: monofunctional biosynthetic peptidoglycan transglycosylase, partial [Kiritimatiellia bacterium]
MGQAPKRRGACKRNLMLATAIALFVALVVPPIQVISARLHGGWPTITMGAQAYTRSEWPERQWRSLDELGHVPRIVLSSEDHGFFQHNGFEWAAMGAALEWNRRHPNEFPRGASTLSQQTARNLFLWQGGGLFRKALEAMYTVWLEVIVPKVRILELYCNLAETGPGAFGFESGAQLWFHKSAKDLTLDEAAVLAALL